MATLAQNITNTISYLDDIRDAIIDTTVGMPENTPVSEYADWIKQLAFVAKLELDSTSFSGDTQTISASRWNTSYTVNITCNTDWTITIPSSATNWMTINKTSGHRNDTVTITCSTNINTSNRSATISVKARTLQENIVINQEKMLFGDVTITVTNNLLRTYFIDGSCNLVSSHGIEQEFLFDMSSDYPEYKQTLNLYQDTWSISSVWANALVDDQETPVTCTYSPSSFRVGDSTTYVSIQVNRV